MPPQSHDEPPAGEARGARGASASSPGSSPCGLPDVPDFDMTFGMANALGSDTSQDSLPTDVSLLDASAAPLDFSLTDLLASTGPAGGDAWNLQGFLPDGDKMHLPPLPFGPPPPAAAEASPPSFQQLLNQEQQKNQPRDLSVLEDHETCSIEIDPMHVHDLRTHFGFIVAFLSSLPATLANKRALPFMYPRLWSGQLPKPIMSAFSAATAYSARSPQSRAWTVKLLADASRDIQREGQFGGSSPADKLARVQALTVVDLMRFLEGDVGLRTAAERDLPILLAWTRELVNLRKELEDEAQMPRPPSKDIPPKSWENWIFLESVRRSIMAAYVFMCIFCMLRSVKPERDMLSEPQSFTASRHLWDADSSVDFYRAWSEKPQYWIENLAFQELWTSGRPTDLDEFTRFIMATQVGVDAMNHFMKGGPWITI